MESYTVASLWNTVFYFTFEEAKLQILLLKYNYVARFADVQEPLHLYLFLISLKHD